MIGRLRGTLVERQLDGQCVLDVAGVGYEVRVPVRVSDRMPVEGENVELHIHTHVREDVLALYGFPSREDRYAFRALLGVSKIGPKVALAILGKLSARELAHAVARGDKAALGKIPGVGAKTADRLLLDLKDKLAELPPLVASAQPAASSAAPLPDNLASVATALISMGYKRSEAERAAQSLEKAANGKPVETLLREALQALG